MRSLKCVLLGALALTNMAVETSISDHACAGDACAVLPGFKAPGTWREGLAEDTVRGPVFLSVVSWASGATLALIP